MTAKAMAQRILGAFRCRLAGIPIPRGGLYIGKQVHFVNGKQIQLGCDVAIRPYCDVFAGDFIRIGEGTDIGTRNRIAGNVIIENWVLFGPDNYISVYDHSYQNVDLPVLKQGVYKPDKCGHEEIRIGEGSWIGTHVAIIGAVHIGKHCVIGANSVVTRDVPDYSVAVGMPARVIKRYNFETAQWEACEGGTVENIDARELENRIL